MSSLYSGLQLGERQIRLLYVQPAFNLDDPIQCDLRVSNFHKVDPEFDALSYVWGNPRVTKTIWVNHQPCEVTVNLFEALTFLRQKRYNARSSVSCETTVESVVLSRWIWIDAICINQNSISERNVQVPLMKDIYSKASTVHVWLGMFDPSIARGLAVLDQVKYQSSTRGGNSRDELVTMVAMDKILMVVNNASADANIPDVVHLLVHPWWRRVWVLQEAISSPSVLIHWHDRSTCFWTLVDAAAALMSGVNLGMQRGLVHLRAVLLRDLRESLDQTIWKFKLIARLRRDTEGVDIDHLFAILNVASASEASEDRDRIYGVLGLLPSSLDIRPRYDVPLEQALADSFFQLIRQTKSLIPMLLVIEPISKEKYSWVPDMKALSGLSQAPGTSLAVTGKVFLQLRHIVHAAGPGSLCSLGPSSSPTRLELRGLLVDAISAVSEPFQALEVVSTGIAWM